MLQETITELVPNHQEIGEETTFESIKSNEEISALIGETLKELRENGTREDIMGQAFGHTLVELLVYENQKYKNKQDELTKKTSVILHAGREYAKSKNIRPNVYLNGFMAEACIALSLTELGFTAIAPTTYEDVNGKIDMLAVDANEPTNPFVLAIQIKNSCEVNEIIALDLYDKNNQIDSSLDGQPIQNIDEFKTKLAYSSKAMVEYLSKGMGRYKGKIIPLLLIIPGGDESENTSYNLCTAAPVKEFSNRLFDKIEKLIYRGEEK